MNTQQHIRIEAVKVKDLYHFACDFFDHPEGQETAPITKRRALAQSKNPNADANDIGLFVAFDGKKCVGYRGILPGILRQGDSVSKIYWASSLYVLPEYRKQKLGQLLVQRWMQIGDIGATGSTDAAIGVYQRCGFREVGPLRYVALKLEGLNRVAAPFRALQRRVQETSLLHRLAHRGAKFSDQWFQPSALRSFYRKVSALCDQALSNARVVEVNRLRPEAEPAGRPTTTRPHFYRSVETINWMLEYPWFGENAPPSTPPCYFGEAKQLFRYHAYELHDTCAQPKGFVVLLAWRSEHRSVVKLLDHNLPSDDARATAFWLAMRLAAQHTVERIELPIEFESLARQLPSAQRIVSITDRRYFLHPINADSPLARAMDSLELNFCDSDLAFY